MNGAAAIHRGPLIDRKGEYSVIGCTGCGYRHVHPLPKVEEIDRWYREHHYADGTRDRIDYHERDRQWWMLAFEDIYAEIDRFRQTGGRRVVDVGCGTGIFLEVGRERGWDVLGFEPSAVAAEHCRRKGLRIVEQPFPPADIDSWAPVDVVHMRNVLEHVPDPADLLKAARRAVVDDGLLVASVPNDYNPLQRAVRDVDGYEPWWIAPPHHLNYFDFDSLESLVERCGYRRVARYCTFPIDLFLAMGDNYVENSALGRACHLKRVRFEETMAAASLTEDRRHLYRAIASAGFGREAIVIARRVRG